MGLLGVRGIDKYIVYGQTDEQKSPYVPQDFVPSALLPKKKGGEVEWDAE